jgi:hypothetical protein
MNKKQKICLLLGTTLFAVLGLFPRCWVSAGPGTNPLPRRWFILNNSRAFVIRDHTFFLHSAGRDWPGYRRIVSCLQRQKGK